MNTLLNSPTILVNADTPAFVSFLAGAEKITSEHQHRHYPNAVRLLQTRFGFNCGDRYIRVSRNEYTPENVLNSSSSHCFVDRTNGDVLKAASWKTPAKGARGNIFDARNGLGRMGPYGTEYNNC